MIVYVSSKKNIMHYFNLCQNALWNHPSLTLKAIGMPMSTAMIVAEMLRHGEFASHLTHTTSTTVHNNRERTELCVLVTKRGTFPAHIVAPMQHCASVFVSLSRSVSYWRHLALKFIAARSAVNIIACGRCMSPLVVLYELFSRSQQHNNLVVGPLCSTTAAKSPYRAGRTGHFPKTHAHFTVASI